MVTEKVQFDLNADFGESNYKSCFARSVVVNSQFHTTKSLDVRQLHKVPQDRRNSTPNHSTASELDEVLRIKKENEVHGDMGRRLSCCSNSSGSGSFAGSRVPTARRNSDLPVENIALQSQVDMLHWQLKQAEASREMYRAVMQQVISFLERAHRSLDALSEKQRGVQRSRSEYHVGAAASTSNPTASECSITPRASVDGYTAFRDFTWRRAKQKQNFPDEIPPEKLSQEAFRLLRTAQSVVQTREPDLAHICPDLAPKDQEFLSQVAREFPSRPPQRATSFSINPQLINPSSDRDIRIATAFNRKLSLQRTPSIAESRKQNTSDTETQTTESKRNSITSLQTTTYGIDDNSKRNSVSSLLKKPDTKSSFLFDSVIAGEKTASPKTGSVSSAEDESGFSSMNSFQEVGLPISNSTILLDDSTQQNGQLSVNSSDSNITQISVDLADTKMVNQSAKLVWNRSDFGLPITHRRWSSTPVEVAQHDPLKVLWV